MNITFDITKEFNSLVNYDYFFDGPPMNPIIFFDLPDSLPKNYQFELMNFGLNINENMYETIRQNALYFDNILDCDYLFERLIILGRAKFNIYGVKGADVKFVRENTDIAQKPFYFSYPYKIEKGDFDFVCGGKYSSSDYFSTIHIIADNNSKATVSFSSGDYFLINSDEIEMETLASSKQTILEFDGYFNDECIVNKINHTPRKMFDINFKNKYFKTCFSNDFNTSIVYINELLDDN